VTWDVGIESLACPVSVITPASVIAVQQFFDARRSFKIGGTPYGTDSKRWPARWHDIVTISTHEIDREEAAARKAINAKIAQH
jgi:hypothetical protein